MSAVPARPSRTSARVLAITVAALAIGAVGGAALTSFFLGRSGGPAQTDYRLSEAQHVPAYHQPEYRFFVLGASPELPLAQVGMIVELDRVQVISFGNMSDCGGAGLFTRPADNLILFVRYTDEIGCTLSVGDWITLSPTYNGLGHNYSVRLVGAGGTPLVTAAVAVPLAPRGSFGVPTRLPNGTIEVPLAGISSSYPPARFEGALGDSTGSLFGVDLKFGLIADTMYTTAYLVDRDRNGLLSAGDAFLFTRLRTGSSYTLTISWKDSYDIVATVTFVP